VKRSSLARGLAFGAVALLALPLSGCQTSRSGSDIGAAPTPSLNPTPTATAGNVGGLAYQANQLAASQPRLAPLTMSPSAVPTDGTTTTSTTAFDSCSVVTPELLQQDLGLAVTTAAIPEPSSFEDPDANDCIVQDPIALVVVEATTRPDQDTPASEYDVTGLPNSAAIPDADRGFAYVPDPTATSGAAEVFVVKGDRGINLVVTGTTPITLDQAVQFGNDLVSAMGS
jgi:hypothetical protein